MTRVLHKLIAFVAILLLPLSLFAQEYGRVLTESFEDGMPQEWLQEKVSGDMSWVVESGGDRPTGAFDGEKRLVFRNVSGKTTKAKTRLVLPAMDISKLYQPILVFAHAQDKWTDDFDTLKILYRASSESRWTELKVYDKYMAKWTVDTVRLIAASKTYQIAFEATDNLGRGVVIDNIEVRSTPNCLTPYDLNASNISNDSATIGWLGSFDAESFDIKVDTVALTAEQLQDPTFKASICNVNVSDVWNYTVKGLEAGTKYYCYIKSNCIDEASEWATYTFSTSNFLSLPYFESFDYASTPGFVSYPKGWYLYSSGSVVKPYINTQYSGSAYYMFSAHNNSKSYVLCFLGEREDNGRGQIAGGAYAYAVLPQVGIDNISDLEISFSTTCYYMLDSERFSLIVGVMTDPENKGSFVAVDTINVDKIHTFEEFTVSLENYKGAGKYIAFMSDFTESNRFLMDDLKVYYRPEVSKVRFDVKIPSATSIKLNFDKQYDKYDVVVATSELNSLANIDATKVAVQTEITNGAEITGLPEATDFFIYARAKKGDKVGEWNTYPVCVRTPAKLKQLPYMVDFEFDKNDSSTFYNPYVGNRKATSKLDPEVTYLAYYYDEVPENSSINKTATVPQRTENQMAMSLPLKYPEAYVAAIFPEMMDVKNTRVAFYSTKHSTSSTSVSAYYVGVMSDASDITTFQPIDTIVPDLRYVYYVYDLNKYKVDGKFFAILLDTKYNFVGLDPTASIYNYCYVDDVRFSTIPPCTSPSNIKIESDLTNPSNVKISWDANGVSKWSVRVAETEYDNATLDTESSNVYLYDTIVETNSIQLKNLEFPGKRYYYWIKSVCDGLVGEWTATDYFETECYGQQPIPYVEDFDKDQYPATTTERVFPVRCMTVPRFTYSGGSTTNYYPQIVENTSSSIWAASGTKAVRFTKSMIGVDKKLYMALPKMAEPVNKLQLSVKLKASAANQTILIGVMTDPNDPTSIEAVTTINPKINEYFEYVVSFADYKGAGEHIVIASDDAFTSNDSYGVCIDDIIVNYISTCARPENMKLVDVANTSATIGWESTANIWCVLVATKQLTLDELANPKVEGNVVRIDTVTTNPCVLNDLAGNTPFVVYIKSLCSDADNSSWSNPLSMRTTCELLNTHDLGVEHFDAYGTGNGKYPPCYIVGNRTAGATAAYIPSCQTTWKHSGGASLKLQSTTTYNGAYAIAPRIDISDITMLRVKFWASAGSAANATDKYAHALIVGVLTDPTDISTFSPVDTVNLTLESRSFDVKLSSYTHDLNGNIGKYVMFYSSFDKNNTVFIDDVEFDTIYACSGNMDVEAVTSNSISVSFDSDATEYQIKYSTAMCDEATLNGETLPSIDVTGKTATITGLDYATNYYLYARAKCGESYSGWSNMTVAVTACLDKFTLPYEDDFEKNLVAGTGAQPLCWNTYYAPNSDYPQVSATAASGTKAVYIYGSSSAASYLVSSEIDVDQLSKCQVSFNARPSAANKNRAIIVGAVTYLDSIATSFEPIDTIIIKMATAAYEKQVVLLDNYKGAAKYLGFRTDYELSEKAGGGFYIDDIIIELIPTCPKPDYFEFGGKTDKTLSFSFVHPGALKYEVKYGAKDFDVETEGSVVEIEGTNFVLSALTAETEYDVYVRAICSETDSSPWSFAGSYTTTAEPIASFPYEFNFNDEAETAKWRFAQDGQPNQWFIGIDTANVVADRLNNTDKALYISKDGGLTANYREKVNESSVNATSYSWAYRTINLEPGVYTISYDWTCYGEFSTSPSDYARVGLLPAVSTFAAGTNKIANYDGSSTNLNATTMPKDWFDLSEHVVYSTSSSTSNYYRLCGIDSTKALNEQWKTVTETIVVTEELAGTYNMLFYWSNNNATSTSSGYSGYYTERGAVIDNLSIVKYTCNKPMYLQLGEYDYQSAEITWSDLTVAPSAYNVKVVLAGVNPDEAAADQIVFEKQVTEKSVKVTGLASNTSYSVYVQAICSDTDKSVWSTPLEFTTVCTPQALDYVFNFDAEDGYYLPPYEASGTTANTTYKVPNCFKSLHAKGIQYKYSSSSSSNLVPLFPYLVKNTSTVITSRSGDYALKFAYTGSASYKTDSIGSGGMIVFPLFEGELEDLQISFWMRSIQHNKSTQKLTVTGIGTKYARKITVGTMTDPDDPSTFVALDTVVYPYEYNSLKSTNLISEDPSGNNYWVEAIVPLAGATGKYIAFKNESYETALNQMFIDDVVISDAQSCLAPTEVEVTSIRSTSAEVNCSHVGASKYVIEIATDVDFSKDLKSYTTTSLPCKIEGLTPATSYNVRIQAVCSEEDASKWSMASTFVTATTMLFEQDFSNSSYCPMDWSRASSPKADDVFDKQTPFSMLLHTAISSTWYSEPAMFDEGMFSTRHISSDIISTNKGWLFSPCIELKENEKQHLVFDLALTGKGDNSPVSPGDRDKIDDKFMVIISDDFGKTWKRENATVWGHSAFDDYQLFNISNTGEQVVIDLTKYAGKVIKVAFYVESNLELDGAKIEIHLDNVHINTYTESAISTAICQTEDYEDAIFFIESSDLKVGTNEAKELSLSTKNNVSDVYYSLAVEVTPMSEKVIEAYICEGDVYSQNNFSGLTEPGVYKQKMPSASGCDSVVTLNLSVTSAVRTMIVDTICYGSSIEWNGVEYNRTGVYIDTLVSAVTGCDSIVTFVLNVKEAITAEAYVNICFGETYTFGTQTISASGDYTETFETAKGCDSIVTLHATALPDYRTTINATIVKGDRYNDNGFVGLSEAGTYTLPLKSKVGDCDSTITLNLRVVDDSTQVAVGNVSALDLVIVPNPVKSGNTLYVNAEFTKEQTTGLVVEVFNAVGQRVYIDEPYIYPIEINGLTQRGVYLVRITTGNGKLYHGKVVVE